MAQGNNHSHKNTLTLSDIDSPGPRHQPIWDRNSHTLTQKQYWPMAATNPRPTLSNPHTDTVMAQGSKSTPLLLPSTMKNNLLPIQSISCIVCLLSVGLSFCLSPHGNPASRWNGDFWLKTYYQNFWRALKVKSHKQLDGLGPVDNRPSTD